MHTHTNAHTYALAYTTHPWYRSVTYTLIHTPWQIPVVSIRKAYTCTDLLLHTHKHIHTCIHIHTPWQIPVVSIRKANTCTDLLLSVFLGCTNW
jgi:uncharacterized DUF497 family protein